jgi:uncharacterized OB-fold protein
MTNQAPNIPRPMPVPDEASQAFFDAAAEGKLLLKYCNACSRFMNYAAEFCDACMSHDLVWKESSGKGTVYSFVIMHQVIHPGFAGVVPYNVAAVELEDGPRLHTNLIDVENDQIQVDMPVEVTFETLENEVTVPKFRPRR